MKFSAALGCAVQQSCRRSLRRTIGAGWALFALLALATPAAAHGGVTGPQDAVQHYGVLLFLVATVLIGVGVLAWVTFSPQADEDEDEDEGEGEPGEAAEAPVTPGGSRANR
jgi:hypothetical protein